MIFHLLNNRINCLITKTIRIIYKGISFINKKHSSISLTELRSNSLSCPTDILSYKISSTALYVISGLKNSFFSKYLGDKSGHRCLGRSRITSKYHMKGSLVGIHPHIRTQLLNPRTIDYFINNLFDTTKPNHFLKLIIRLRGFIFIFNGHARAVFIRLVYCIAKTVLKPFVIDFISFTYCKERFFRHYFLNLFSGNIEVIPFCNILHILYGSFSISSTFFDFNNIDFLRYLR